MERSEEPIFKPGSIIYSEKPFVYCLSSSVRTENCDFCFRSEELLKCSGCQYVYYCGKACQKEGWPVHKFECKKLKKVAPRILPDGARMLARIIWKLSKGGDKIQSYYTKQHFRLFKDLMSHSPNIKKDSKRMEHFVSLYGVLFDYLGDEFLPNEAEVLGIYGRMCINTFNILNDEYQSLGTGMYLGASVVDHSCKPNVVATFDGPVLNLRTLESMQSLNWAQICISYIDVLNTTKNRREELQQMYYFLCECPKCLEPEINSEIMGASCPNTNCDNGLELLENHQITSCFKCGERIKDELRTKFKEVTDFTTIHLETMKHKRYFDVSKICLKKQEGLFHKFNIQHVKTKDLTFESCIDLQNFTDAVRIGLELIDPFYKYYGKVHPMTALLHLKLGKILLYQDHPKESLEHLKNAKEIMKISHGTNSRVFIDELIPLLHQATVEEKR